MQKQLKEEFYVKTHLPNFLSKMTDILKANGAGKGFIVGNKVGELSPKIGLIFILPKKKYIFC